MFFSHVLIQTYEVYSDILWGRSTFLPTLVRTICSVVVDWCSGISWGNTFVHFRDGKILSSCDWGMTNRCHLLQWSFWPFSVKMRYDLGYLLITFPFHDQVLSSCKQTWSLMFMGESFLCFLGICFEALSWYVVYFILGNNVHNSCSISFVAGDEVFFLPSAMRKASNARSLSSSDFKHFNRVLLTVCIVLSSMPFDCANFGLLVSCSKF